MMRDKKKSLKFVLIGILGYTSFSFSLLWNRMNPATIMIILVSFALIGVCFYINYKLNSYIFIKSALFTYFLYISSKIPVIFLHETGHSITALLYGVSLTEVRILSLLQGVTLIEESSSSIIMSNLTISGVLGIVIILVLLLIGLLASRKDLKGNTFVPVYIVTSLHLFEEIRYWYTSILKRFGDGWDFIKLNPQINCVTALFIINSILWTGTTILFLILVYPFSKKFIRKLYKSFDVKDGKEIFT